jgi:hypothetical protein
MTHQNNTPKYAVIFGFFIVCLLSLGLTAKTVLTANKPQIQKVEITNYSVILQEIEHKKQELIDSIKNESRELKQQNEMLLAKLNTKPKVVIQREIQKEINHTNSNQIVISEKYTPHVQIIQKKSGNLEIIE